MTLLRRLALLIAALALAITPTLVTAAGAINSVGAVVGDSFIRPADTTAYASGDLVANSTTAGSVVPISIPACRQPGTSGMIVRVRLSTTKTGLAGTDVFRVHIFKTSPTVANGDNGAFSVNGRASLELATFDVTLDRVYSDGAKGFASPSIGNAAVYDCANGSQFLYGLIEARGAYTPASGETYALAVEVFQD